MKLFAVPPGQRLGRQFPRRSRRGPIEAATAAAETAIERDRRYDGKWVLRTTTDLDAADVAWAYKQLWTVEEVFRTMKSLLETRPIWHHLDETIRGHVFCSFLALRLRFELESRLPERGESFEWASILRDLNEVTEVEVAKHGTRFVLRSEAPGSAGKVFQAAGVALPPTIRKVS